jgi:hypothetical protein
MGQDATKVLMGATGSSSKAGTEVFASDPATFLAGIAVRRASTNLLSTTKADGRWIGISLGANLSDSKKTTVLASGDKVPILLELAPARGVVTITSYANLIATSDDTLKIGATTFTFHSSATDENHIAAVTSNNQTATNLAAAINAHSVAGLLFIASAVGAVVTITAISNTTVGSTIDLVYTDTPGNSIGLTVDAATFTGGNVTPDYVSQGKHVYISDTSGKAYDPKSQSTISNAIYASGVLTAVQEDGTTAYAALVDMIGGL